MLIDPLAYLGDTIDKIFYMIIDVAEEGKKEDFSKLEEKVIWAIELRDCLTYKEKDAINKALSSKYIEFIRTGEYLDEIKNYIDEAKDLIKDSYEEEREDILKGIFSDGMGYLSDFINAGIEEESVKIGGFLERFK